MSVSTEGALAAVTAPCTGSPFKDNRHVWEVVATMDHYFRSYGGYEARRCSNCRLVIFMYEANSDVWNSTYAPTKNDHVYYAHFEYTE